jgi:hypothetical protein
VSQLSPIDQVLQETNQLLDRPGHGAVSDVHVRKALRWPPERLDEVRRMMAQLVEEGSLLGPRNATRAGCGMAPGASSLLMCWVLRSRADGDSRQRCVHGGEGPGRGSAVPRWYG